MSSTIPRPRTSCWPGRPKAGVYDPAGHAIGLDSGRPVLQLDDLAVALRAYGPGGEKASWILCSIDPTEEGLERMQAFLNQIGKTDFTPDDTEFIVNGLRNSLGYQNIRVEGVSAKTHFARVMIEADYRMKLIGIGVEKPRVKLASYVDRAAPASVSRNALQRWFFVPDYQCVRVSADRLGMQLVGNGVKLVDEDQVVSTDGSRKATGRSNKASKAFVTAFTQKYPEIAASTPVYAELRNCIDLAIAAAFIQQQDYYTKAGWRMETFGDESLIPVQRFNTPSPAFRNRRGQRLARNAVDDAHGRRRVDAADQSLAGQQYASRRGWSDRPAARIAQSERSGRRPLVVGLSRGRVCRFARCRSFEAGIFYLGAPGPVTTRWKCSCTSRSTTRRTPSTRQCGSLSSCPRRTISSSFSPGATVKVDW